MMEYDLLGEYNISHGRIPADLIPLGMCIKCKVRVQYFAKLCRVCYKWWKQKEPKTWSRLIFEKSSEKEKL